MDRKQLCIANVQYKKPSVDGAKQSQNLIRYLTYRESRDEKARQVAGRERWFDHGMGGSVGEIVQRCDDLKSQHVLTFSLVVNPNPQLIAMIPPEQREQFVRELTEQTVEGFFEARGLDTGCEFSYVLHHRVSDDLQSPGMHNPHTHVVLPGTVWSEEAGERIALYFSQNKKVDHIALLHEITEQNTTELLEQYVGLDWEQRIDALEMLREEQKQILDTPPHGFHLNDTGEAIPFWGGIRQVDENQCAVGYYVPVANDDGELTIQFRPVALGLDREYAQRLSAVVAEQLQQHPEHQLQLYQETIRILLEEQHEELHPMLPTTQPIDLDL